MEAHKNSEPNGYYEKASRIFGTDNMALFEQYSEATESNDLITLVKPIIDTLAPALPHYLTHDEKDYEHNPATPILPRIKRLFNAVDSLWKSKVKKNEKTPSDKTVKLNNFRNFLLNELATKIMGILRESSHGHVCDAAKILMDLAIADPFAFNMNTPNNQKVNLFYMHRAQACLAQHGESLADSLKTYEAEYDDDPETLLDLVQDLVKTRKVSFKQHQIGNTQLIISGDEHPGARRLRKKHICTIEIMPDVTANEGVKSFTLNLDRITGELHLGAASSVPFSGFTTPEIEDPLKNIILSLLADDLEVQPDETGIEDEEPESYPSKPSDIATETAEQVQEVTKEQKKSKKRRVDPKESYNVRGLQLKRIRRMLRHILGSDSLVRRNGHDIYEVPNGGKIALPQHGSGAEPFVKWAQRAGMSTKNFIKK